jgi:UPF0755 protein
MARSALDRPLRLPQGGLLIQVVPGQSLREVSTDLAARRVLDSAWTLTLFGRLTGDASRLKAGEYRIVPGTTPAELLRLLVTGSVVQHSLTVVEGWTFRRLREALAGHEALEHTLEGVGDPGVMALLGRAGVHPEGRFLPETYFFPRGTPDLEVLRRALRHMDSFLADAWRSRAPDLPLSSPDAALVLASIVEKETGRAEERRRIAGVFVRRLRRAMPLQADPTVIYGLGDDFDGDIRRADLRRDTPYNTYVRAGLPPTPIALPGRQSILAALDPEPGEAIYFVARGDGSHHFSDTLAEHQRAVARYQVRRQPPSAQGESGSPGP